jgi:hypothetical protein
MTSDLRTRIAAAMKERAERDTDWMLADLADAVIAELGLRENFAVADEDGDFVYVGADRENSEKYTVHPGDHLLRRYVTDWKADDE